MHRILQLLPDVPLGKRQDFVRKMVSNAGHDEGTASEILTLVERPDLGEVFSTEGLSEVPVMAEIKSLGLTISGRIDRLILRPGETVIVDYKTDRDWPREPGFVKPDYLLQMAAYQAALKGVYPGITTRCAILWTAAPCFMVIPDSLLAEALHHNAVA